MSFYPQPNSYACGPFALKYALVMLGQFRDEKIIAKRSGSTWWYGTDEIGLAKAARSFKCTMKYFHSADRDEARKKLLRYIKRGIPCVLSVDRWEHWFTVLGADHKKYVVVDSSRDKVIVVYSERTLLQRWFYEDEEEGRASFDGYAMIPRYKVKTKARFTLEKARFVMRERNADLAMQWDTYFNDLIHICKPHSPNAKRTMSLPEFLRRNEGLLVRTVANWHGSPTYAELKKILRNLKFVAETYDLLIYTKDQKKALVDLAAVLMMYSCGKYGMDPLYRASDNL
jgi:hypothetical protein